MSTEKSFRIAIIDDTEQVIFMLTEELQDDYLLQSFTSAENIVQQLKQCAPLPELILLDVNMPGVNGYEACSLIKKDPALHEIEIIFLTGNDSTEEILRGMDAGATDYITKPWDPDILQSKIRRVEQSCIKRQQLKKQADEVNKLVFTVMSESGSLGNVVNFLRKSFSNKTPEALLSTTIETLQAYELNALVSFQVGEIEITDSTSTPANELELELLHRLHGHGEPFLEKGSRTFVIQEHIVVLVKNMPADASKRGSLKDNLKILLEGANAQLDHLAEIASTTSRTMNTVNQTLLSTSRALDEINSQQEAHKRQSMEIFDQMIQEVEEAFFSMGLSDAQEKILMGIMQEAAHNALNHFESGLVFDERIREIVGDLSHVVTQSLGKR